MKKIFKFITILPALSSEQEKKILVNTFPKTEFLGISSLRFGAN